MDIIIREKGKIRINKLLDWMLYIFFYTITLIIVSLNFKSMYIEEEHFYLYSFLIVLIVYVLNKTVKPILVRLTIPITGLTLGLFYPFINLFILKLADWILGSHFNLKNIWIALIISILLSICNIVVEQIIIKPIIRKFKKEGESIE